MTTLFSPLLSGFLGLLLLAGEPAVQTHPLPDPSGETSAPDDAMSEAQRWLVYQYILGGAEDAPRMLHAVIEEIDDPDKREEAWPLLSVYAACLGARNKPHLDGWARESLAMSDDFKMVFAYASWYADFPGSAERLRPLIDSMPEDLSHRRRIEFMLDQEPADFATLPVSSPAALDYLWACFLATGETRFVDRIMTALPPKHQSFDDPEFGDIQDILLAGAARWSLASNAFQHPRVLKHLQHRRASEPEPWPELDNIIQIAQEQLSKRPSPAPPEPDRTADAEEPAAPRQDEGKNLP